MCNLASLPQYREIARNLMKLLWRKIQETHDTSLAETHYYPMRVGIVGPNADYRIEMEPNTEKIVNS